jgi:uncharacterized protein GlcG (DUF336 family)
MIKFHALAVIVSLSTLSHLAVAAPDPLPTETFKVLPLTLAIEAAEAAIASCKAQGYSITAAIVDRAGNLKVHLVGDGVNDALTRELPPRKAYTAAVQRITTIELAKAIAKGAFNPTLYDVHMVIDGGGVPIKAGNEVIGGIGVGGTPEGDQDEACAKAGLAKIGNRVN